MNTDENDIVLDECIDTSEGHDPPMQNQGTINWILTIEYLLDWQVVSKVQMHHFKLATNHGTKALFYWFFVQHKDLTTMFSRRLSNMKLALM